jgi:hypothetical protein
MKALLWIAQRSVALFLEHLFKRADFLLDIAGEFFRLGRLPNKAMVAVALVSIHAHRPDPYA